MVCHHLVWQSVHVHQTTPFVTDQIGVVTKFYALDVIVSLHYQSSKAITSTILAPMLMEMLPNCWWHKSLCNITIFIWSLCRKTSPLDKPLRTSPLAHDTTCFAWRSVKDRQSSLKWLWVSIGSICKGWQKPLHNLTLTLNKWLGILIGSDDLLLVGCDAFLS